VPAGGKKTVLLPAKVVYLELLKVLRDIRPGAVIPYAAEMGMSVEAPAVGRLRLPLRKEGQLPVPTVPEVAVKEIKWHKLALEEAGGTVKVRFVNRNQFPMDLAKFDYRLSLGGTEVAVSSVARPAAFAADGGAAEIDIPITLSPRNLGLAFFRMLTGEGASYGLRGNLEVTTPFGPANLAFDQGGSTVFRK
jgi:LEA14-like dessication related protein